MKNKKTIAIFITALAILSLALGIVGYLEYRKGNIPDDVKHTVTYRYYLNNEEVNEMPTNATLISSSSEISSSTTEAEKLYAFNTASCTNKVTYEWDDDAWTFTPANTADTTCSLYFVTTTNELTVTATNAVVTPLASNKITRGEDAIIKITPTEGYAYKETICTNNEVVEWDLEKSELTIKNINAETTCAATYELSKFSVEVKVSNGSGATTVEYNYGTKVEINITASSGYGTPEITCSNDQKGTWANGVFTIAKLTKTSICNVNFKQLQSAATYTVSIDTGAYGVLATGASAVSVISGGSVSFPIVVTNDNYILSTATCTGGSSRRENNMIIVSNVTQNISCTVVYAEQ